MSLIEAEHLEVDFGLELLDASDQLLADISGDLAGGVIERGNFRSIHGTCRLVISRELLWGSQRVKPYMTLSDGTTTQRWVLGVYLLSTPERQAGETPATYEVDGYDKLVVLNSPYGSTYQVAAGANYVDTVEALIEGAGESRQLIVPSTATLPSGRIWEIDERNTTLGIVNDLLAAIGYRGLWVDRDGYFRSEPYDSPSVRSAMWTYDTSSATTSVAEFRVQEADYFDAPNRWVFVRDDPGQGLPQTSDGRYEVANDFDGPTSIAGRGRVITRIVRLDAADHASLVAQGDRIVENDKPVVYRLRLTVSPNPNHWHFDVVRVVDPELGVNHNHQVASWALPLDGADMGLEMKRVV